MLTAAYVVAWLGVRVIPMPPDHCGRPSSAPPQRHDPCGLCPAGYLSELCYLIVREQQQERAPLRA